jgi:hypothetical protein
LSFFSGHTALAFSFAVSAGTIASMRSYRNAGWVLGSGLTMAAATGYLRIAADRHYFTDVLTGGRGLGRSVPARHARPARGHAERLRAEGAAALATRARAASAAPRPGGRPLAPRRNRRRRFRDRPFLEFLRGRDLESRERAGPLPTVNRGPVRGHLSMFRPTRDAVFHLGLCRRADEKALILSPLESCRGATSPLPEKARILLHLVPCALSIGGRGH